MLLLLEQLVAVGRTELRLETHDLWVAVTADLDVLQELLLAHEFLATHLAGIWLPLAVDKVMNVAILGATELFAADLAAEVLGACVAQQMLLQVYGVTKGGLTVLAMQIAQLHVH